MLQSTIKFLKMISVWIIVICCTLILLETTFYFIKKNATALDIGWLYRTNELIADQITDSCARMRGHPFLTLARDHANDCYLKGAKLLGPLVYYGQKDDDTNVFRQDVSKYYILTLGGSTTDGAQQAYADGETWPYLLNKKLTRWNRDFSIINGGVASYGSHQELLTLLTIGGNISAKLSHIISYNGINDLEGYRGLNKDLEEVLPFWTKMQLDTFRYQKYFRVDGAKYFPKLFPNIRWAIDLIDPIITSALPDMHSSRKMGEEVNNGINTQYSKEKIPRWESALLFKDQKTKTPSEQWLYNVRIMHAISGELGAKYMVFLQPTMGISDEQIPNNPSTDDYKVWKEFSDGKKIEYLHQINYWEKIKRHYEKLQFYCGQLPFCHDISDIAPPIGNHYSDIRHHNKYGNKIIAEAIFKKLDLSNY